MIRLRQKFLGFILIPLIAVVMPWPWFYRIARRLSSIKKLYATEVEMAVAGIKVSGQFVIDEVWQRHFRLYKIIDAADPWICRIRGRSWIDRYVDVEGEWPSEGNFAVSSIHFGTGLWVLQHVHKTRGVTSTVSRPRREWDTVFSRPMRYYLKAFEHVMEHAAGGPMTPTGQGLTRRLEQRIKQGYNLLFLIDVPNSKNTTATNFLGRPTYFAGGLVNLCKRFKLPIVPYVMMLNFKTGRRRLVIGKALEQDLSEAEALQALADFLDPFIREQSEGWQFWGQYPHFLDSESREH